MKVRDEESHLTADEHRAAPDGVESVTVDDVRSWLSQKHEPEFILPTRFRDVSFDSFEVDAAHPEHELVRERVIRFLRPAPAGCRFRRRPRPPDDQRGLFLVGPPGVGKTHLLAAAYRAASAPKLYASFDELAAAAGPLGMSGLVRILRSREIVCIDEVVIEDPGNIMLLVTLLGHMLANGTRILATANVRPEAAADQSGWVRSFERELGQISRAFTLQKVEGPDRRVVPRSSSPQVAWADELRLRCCWAELVELLRDTHPMHDAVWLQRIDAIRIRGEIQPSNDKDETLRLVRFIDRVYDRDVSLRFDTTSPDPDDLVAVLVGDPRFTWHVARGRSRLQALIGER